MSKIDLAPASEALDLLREARGDAKNIFDNDDRSALSFEEIVEQMRVKGWGTYDTRLALSSLSAQITNEGLMEIPEHPYEWI